MYIFELYLCNQFLLTYYFTFHNIQKNLIYYLNNESFIIYNREYNI